MSGARSMRALSDWRPIRPKPLMPTRVAMMRDLLDEMPRRFGAPARYVDVRPDTDQTSVHGRSAGHPDRASRPSYQRGRCTPPCRSALGPAPNGPNKEEPPPSAGAHDLIVRRRRSAAADPEDLAAADRAGALDRGLAVLHRDLLGVLDFDLLLVLDAIGLCHVGSSSTS